MSRRHTHRAFVTALASASLVGCGLVADLSRFDGARLVARDGGSGASDTGIVPVEAAADDGAVEENTSVPNRDAGRPDSAAKADAAHAGDASSTNDATPEMDANPPVDAGSGNLLANPGFELGVPPWTTFVDGQGHSATLSVSTTEAHSGSNSGWVSSRTATFQGTVQDITASVVQGHAYTMSAWARIAPANGALDAAPLSDAINLTAAIDCLVSSTPTTTYPHAGSGAVTSTEWTFCVGAFQVPICDLVSVQVYVEGPQPGIDLLVDDVSVLP